MSYLVNCPVCSHQISAIARTCSQCGHPLRRRSNFFNISAIVTFLIFLALLAVEFWLCGYVTDRGMNTAIRLAMLPTVVIGLFATLDCFR